MNKKSISKSNLFIIELTIVIVFFIFASSIVLNVFVKANQLANDSAALNGAIIAVQTNAEKYCLIPIEEAYAGEITLYYDKNWQPSGIENAFYMINASTTLKHFKHGTMACLSQQVFYANRTNKDIIYELESKKFYKRQ